MTAISCAKVGKKIGTGVRVSQVKISVRVRFLSIFTTEMYQKLSTERLMHYLVASTKEENDNFSGLIYG